MRTALLALSLAALLLHGCCASTPQAQSSGTCPYGTYGSSCTAVCKIAGTDNCFSECMDGIRAEGLGDATTCCKESFRMNCESTCKPLGSSYGSEAEAECMSGCMDIIAATGISPDICYLPNA